MDNIDVLIHHENLMEFFINPQQSIYILDHSNFQIDRPRCLKKVNVGQCFPLAPI